jgi:protein-disulfide isomerase
MQLSVTDHALGIDQASFVLVEYGDFESLDCIAVEPAVKRLCHLYRENMLFVFRHFPMEDIHPNALLAAEAAEAAAAQGRFWPMHDLLLSQKSHLRRSDLEEFAKQIGLNMTRFRAELDDEIYRQRVREHQQAGRKHHLKVVPTFLINGVTQIAGNAIDQLALKLKEEFRRVSRHSGQRLAKFNMVKT